MLSAMRHYAESMRAAGYAVDYVRAPDFVHGLREHVRKRKPTNLFTMAASSFQARRLQSELSTTLGVPMTVLPNIQFLVESFRPYPDPQPGKRYVMENFYRQMRRHLFVLLEENGDPSGGQWNFDADNRKPLPKYYKILPPCFFHSDALTNEVMREVERAGHGVGTAEGFDLAVTHAQAERALKDFIENRLANFGPYEDAMSSRDGRLYHSLLSAYVNIGLLEPLQMVTAAEAAYRAGKAPISSVEGFIRQVLGWREYIYWQYWRQMPDLLTANGWAAKRPMPAMFWSADTDLNCLRQVVRRVIDSGYSHHIERLMLICNFCMLAGVNPAAVSEWFLTFYVDAYEWVVLPNVIGMGLNADGGQIATKPYIASANYINRMSDYCGSCQYDPKQRTGPRACPFNFLYWSFLLKHETKLRAQPRLGPAVLGLSRIPASERSKIEQEAERYLSRLESFRGYENGS
ncbi:MAG: cryptochrome/photolyase family protein [Terriglobales bacterium]